MAFFYELPCSWCLLTAIEQRLLLFHPLRVGVIFNYDQIVTFWKITDIIYDHIFYPIKWWKTCDSSWHRSHHIYYHNEINLLAKPWRDVRNFWFKYYLQSYQNSGCAHKQPRSSLRFQCSFIALRNLVITYSYLQSYKMVY